jgi:hypothetical protein
MGPACQSRLPHRAATPRVAAPRLGCCHVFTTPSSFPPLIPSPSRFSLPRRRYHPLAPPVRSIEAVLPPSAPRSVFAARSPRGASWSSPEWAAVRANGGACHPTPPSLPGTGQLILFRLLQLFSSNSRDGQRSHPSCLLIPTTRLVRKLGIIRFLGDKVLIAIYISNLYFG